MSEEKFLVIMPYISADLVWQYSKEMLYSLFEEEYTTGTILFQDV